MLESRACDDVCVSLGMFKCEAQMHNIRTVSLGFLYTPHFTAKCWSSTVDLENCFLLNAPSVTLAKHHLHEGADYRFPGRHLESVGCEDKQTSMR
jgi:hypothetical protein